MRASRSPSSGARARAVDVARALLAGWTADSGRVILAGQDLTQLDEDGRARLRAEVIDSSSSRSTWFPRLTALEGNVMLPLELAGRRDAARGAARGAGARRAARSRRPLSEAALGWRAAARRAGARLRHAPAVLFADEPTGNLDTVTGARVTQLLFEMNSSAHDGGPRDAIANSHRRCVHARDGRRATGLNP